LPSISDPDGDGWSVSTNMGSASSFIQYSSGTFTIAPTVGNVGTFAISVTVTDNNPVPLSSQYTFTVTVSSASTTTNSSSSNSTNSTSNSTFAGVVISALSANATSAEKAAYEQKMLLYQSFGAKIASISEIGLVKIQFFTPIIVPNVNLSLFNDSYLDVTAITGPYNDPNNDLFTWSATYID